MKNGMINRSAAKKFVLDRVKEMRPYWTCTRVSGEYLDNLSARVRAMITKDIHSHPSGCGKTFRP